MSEVAAPPQRMGSDARGVGARPGDYRWKRSRLHDDSFESMGSFELSSGDALDRSAFSGWSVCVYAFRDRGTVFCGYASPLGEVVASHVQQYWVALSGLLKSEYGYVVRQERWVEPILYAMGLLAHNGRYPAYSTTPYTLNISQWRWARVEAQGGAILRDVYPINILGEKLQQAPIGYSGVSLIDWLRSEPDERGVLEPIDGARVLWTPPVERIPILREQLYRAGRIFYSKFIKPRRIIPNTCGQSEPEPLYRPDLMAPWEAEGQIPDFLSPGFYKDKDPGLTY
ncbi:MAG: hypothetical protein H6813_06505 [Phycisphaeraceae bacterium]|nr:hypothetical protein [Phycisphaeraceae bacterium]MCB9848123.1 hypothetical protein [Phycisphaeraceae bacterium]